MVITKVALYKRMEKGRKIVTAIIIVTKVIVITITKVTIIIIKTADTLLIKIKIKLIIA